MKVSRLKLLFCFVVFLIAPILTAQNVGIITTVAGTTPPNQAPVRGFSGDGGPASAATLALANLTNDCDPARFEQVSRLSLDRNGNIYFTDSNNQRIRRIDPQGNITTVAGTGDRPPINNRCEATGGGAATGDGGPARNARLYNPADVIFAPNGDMVIIDQQNNRIRRVDSAGNITTIAGSNLHAFYAPGTPATTSGLDWPSSAAYDSQGNLYFAELHSHRIARIGSDNRITTVAGTGFPGYNGDNRSALSAQLYNPAGIAIDSQGNIFVADQSNHRVRRITPAGTITTVAGTGQAGFSGDGAQATAAALNQPTDVDVDTKGNIYIADMGNHRIRRIGSDGVITTVAGNGQIGRGADGAIATDSSLNFPVGVTADPNGDFYIVDWQNYLIRKVIYGNLPVISSGGVVNGASFLPSPIPVSVGSFISVFGLNLAPQLVSFDTVPLPTQLAGVSLLINGQPVPLFAVSPNQINAQLPYDAQIGPATAAVRTPAGTSAPEPFTISTAAPGILLNGRRAVALNQDGTLNTADNPEAKGRLVILYGTGIGPVEPPVATGAAASTTVLSYAIQDVTATIGTADADVLFAGLAPGFIGLAQLNIRIPASAPTGAEVPITVRVGRQSSNSPLISIR